MKRSYTILYVDDDIDDLLLISEAFEKYTDHLTVVHASNGAEGLKALEKMGEKLPCLLIIDINMPVKNGKEVLAEIKSDEELSKIPTVMLSTSENTKDVEDAFNGGASLYVRKPYSFRNFILMLKKIFSLKWTGQLEKRLRQTFFLSERNISKKM